MEAASPIASSFVVSAGQSGSSGVTTGGGVESQELQVNIGGSHVLTLCVTSSLEKENGGSGGARTRHISNVYGAETASPSQIASQESGARGRDLSKVVAAWEGLPAALKSAILAIVGSATGKEGQ